MRKDLGNSMTPSTIVTCILQKFQKKKREKWAEGLFEEIIAEPFHNLGKETDIQMQEAENPHQNQQKQANTRHIVVKFAK